MIIFAHYRKIRKSGGVQKVKKLPYELLSFFKEIEPIGYVYLDRHKYMHTCVCVCVFMPIYIGSY